MQIQLNTDNHLRGSEALTAQLEAELQSAFGRRFSDRLTRIEVHLNDVNGAKKGEDKRCMMEARPAGLDPISVDHVAPSVELAIEGASGKLVRALERAFGKQDERRGAQPG